MNIFLSSTLHVTSNMRSMTQSSADTSFLIPVRPSATPPTTLYTPTPVLRPLYPLTTPPTTALTLYPLPLLLLDTPSLTSTVTLRYFPHIPGIA